MSSIWTHGVWTVKPGREDEFVAGWREMARTALDEFDPPEPPHFFRDRDRPNVFRSFGPWRRTEEIERFRASIAPRVAAMDELIESFETYTLDEIGLDD